jgi:hypothetical protein
MSEVSFAPVFSLGRFEIIVRKYSGSLRMEKPQKF